MSSDANFQPFNQETGPEADAKRYVAAAGSPYDFVTPASEDNERSPRTADKEWQERQCQVVTDCSNQIPPWICVTKCDDENALPIPELTLTIREGLRGTSNWKGDDGTGDRLTVCFWRLKLPGGKKGPWNFFLENREGRENLGPQPGQHGT